MIIGSSDLMTRNLHHRIEVCVSIKTPDCKKELIDYFELQWQDTDKAVMLLPNLDQKKEEESGTPKLNAQFAIYNYLKNK